MLLCAMSAHDNKKDCDVAIVSFSVEPIDGLMIACCLTKDGKFYQTFLDNLTVSKLGVKFIFDKLCLK